MAKTFMRERHRFLKQKWKEMVNDLNTLRIVSLLTSWISSPLRSMGEFLHSGLAVQGYAEYLELN